MLLSYYLVHEMRKYYMLFIVKEAAQRSRRSDSMSYSKAPGPSDNKPRIRWPKIAQQTISLKRAAEPMDISSKKQGSCQIAPH